MIHTRTAAALSMKDDPAVAAREVGEALRERLGGPADAVIAFASARYDPERLLEALGPACGSDLVVGSTSAGEFTSGGRGEGALSVLGIRSATMRFAMGVGRDLSRDPAAAARQTVSGFRGLEEPSLPYRSALVMTDALAGHADALVEELTLATGGNYSFFGGGAGDDGRFQKTYVFAGTEAVSDAAVGLEILSVEPLGIGVSHGWVPASEGLRVTEVRGNLLVGLNGAPALEAFEAHAEATGQSFDPGDPLAFFLHNILGIRDQEEFRLRVPLGVTSDGEVQCAAPIPQGSVVHVMRTTSESAVLAAQQATRSAIEALGSRRPGAALVFDCVATRLRLGRGFDDELAACAELLQPANFAGCNTYGQIARAEGQFSGFHNCTAVVCAFPS